MSKSLRSIWWGKFENEVLARELGTKDVDPRGRPQRWEFGFPGSHKLYKYYWKYAHGFRFEVTDSDGNVIPVAMGDWRLALVAFFSQDPFVATMVTRLLPFMFLRELAGLVFKPKPKLMLEIHLPSADGGVLHIKRNIMFPLDQVSFASDDVNIRFDAHNYIRTIDGDLGLMEMMVESPKDDFQMYLVMDAEKGLEPNRQDTGYYMYSKNRGMAWKQDQPWSWIRYGYYIHKGKKFIIKSGASYVDMAIGDDALGLPYWLWFTGAFKGKKRTYMVDFGHNLGMAGDSVSTIAFGSDDRSVRFYDADRMLVRRGRAIERPPFPGKKPEWYRLDLQLTEREKIVLLVVDKADIRTEPSLVIMAVNDDNSPAVNDMIGKIGWRTGLGGWYDKYAAVAAMWRIVDGEVAEYIPVSNEFFGEVYRPVKDAWFADNPQEFPMDKAEGWFLEGLQALLDQPYEVES